MAIHGISKLGRGNEYPYFNDPIPFSGYITGQRYLPTMRIIDTGSQALSQDNIYYVPYVPRVTHTFTGIGVYNSSAGDTGKKIRLGIFESDANGDPDDLLLDAGEIVLDASVAYREITIAQELDINTLYWLAYIGDSSTSIEIIKNVAAENTYPPKTSFGVSSFNLASPLFTPDEAQAYGALPDPAGTLGVVAEAPIIYLEA